MISGKERKEARGGEREREREGRRKRRRMARERERLKRGDERGEGFHAMGKGMAKEGEGRGQGSLGRALDRLSLTQHSYPGPKCDVILHNSPNCIVAAAAPTRSPTPSTRRSPLRPVSLCPTAWDATRCTPRTPPIEPGELKLAIALTGAHHERARPRLRRGCAPSLFLSFFLSLFPLGIRI